METSTKIPCLLSTPAPKRYRSLTLDPKGKRTRKELRDLAAAFAKSKALLAECGATDQVVMFPSVAEYEAFRRKISHGRNR